MHTRYWLKTTLGATTSLIHLFSQDKQVAYKMVSSEGSNLPRTSPRMVRIQLNLDAALVLLLLRLPSFLPHKNDHFRANLAR